MLLTFASWLAHPDCSYSMDGFMLNLAAVLLTLCDPFTAPNSDKAAKIDPSYLLSTHRLNLKDETRLCATADDVMYALDSLPRSPLGLHELNQPPHCLPAPSPSPWPSPSLSLSLFPSPPGTGLTRATAT